MSSFRILVVDDHPIFRFGLSSLLRSHEGWEVCGEAADGRDGVEKCKHSKPDLVILDICLPKLNGVDAARQILKHNPAQAILILTAVDSEQVIRECLEAGVRGWVFKSDETMDLITAVEALQRRKTIFSSRVSDLIMDGYKQHRLGPAAPKVAKLSPREREVVQLVSEGKASKEVATILSMTVATAETHRSNILRKLKLHSIAELVLYAVRNEIVHVQSPTVLRFPNPGEGTRLLATSAFAELPKAGDGRVDVVRREAN
ncbi:MAG: response regulator transcription factor [Candidatus Sulfotelmatobacter sp.]